jgi:hypothetical protein
MEANWYHIEVIRAGGAPGGLAPPTHFQTEVDAMKHFGEQQSGMTLIGLMFVLAIIGAAVTFAVRCFPLYNEKMQIVSAINSVVSQPDSAAMTESELHKRFLANLNATTNINRFSRQNLKEHLSLQKPEKAGETKAVHLKYEARNKLVYDLELVLVVDQTWPVRGNEGGE